MTIFPTTPVWFSDSCRQARTAILLAIAATFGFYSMPDSVLAQPTNDAASEKLPPGVQLPGKRSPLMDIQKEEISVDDYQKFRRRTNDYVQALRAGELSGQNKAVVNEGIRIKVLAMSLSDANLKAIKEDRSSLRKKLLRDIKNYAGAQQLNARQRLLFREHLFDEIIAQSKKLMDNNLMARFQAANLLAELNIEEEDRRNGTPPVPYTGVAPALQEIIQNPDQDLAVKIVATRGLQRIMDSEAAKLARNDRLNIALLLTAQLKDSNTHFGYQVTLIETLESSKIDVDRADKPFIVQALAEVMSDKKRDPRVRSQAAYSLGRVPLATNVNLSLLAYQTAVLTEELVAEYNAKPQQYYWVLCFARLYAAFQPVNPAEKTANAGFVLRADGTGFANHKALVDNAWQKVLPVYSYVFTNRGAADIPGDKSAPLIDWLKNNDPAQYTIAPGLPPLSSTKTSPATVSER